MTNAFTHSDAAKAPIAVTAREAAAMLSISPRLLQDLPISRVRLSAGAIRYLVHDLRRYAEGQRIQADSEGDGDDRTHSQLRVAGRFVKPKSKRGGHRLSAESPRDSKGESQVAQEYDVTENGSCESGFGSGREVQT